MEKQRSPSKRRLLVWLAWTIFIFLRSFQPAELSGQESGWILSLLLKLFPFPWLTDHMVRKAAHFTEFAILGILSTRFPPAPSTRFSRWTAVWLSLSLCALAALCDETIQLFSEGRSGQVSDVWLDIGGAAFGLALSLLLRRITARRAGGNTP